MNTYFVKTPKIIQRLYPKRIWALQKDTNAVFLSFDDGPIPKITPWVLEELKKYDAKATFFCIGENIKKYPEILKRIISEGHSVGNHTYNHLNGWKTNTEAYIQNCNKNKEILKKSKGSEQDENTELFRPPYGKLTSKQSKILQEKGYKIIMWDILSGDFDKKASKEKCLEKVLENIELGSIIVFHDSLKAKEKLKYMLPKVLDFLKKKDIECKAIV